MICTFIPKVTIFIINFLRVWNYISYYSYFIINVLPIHLRFSYIIIFHTYTFWELGFSNFIFSHISYLGLKIKMYMHHCWLKLLHFAGKIKYSICLLSDDMRFINMEKMYYTYSTTWWLLIICMLTIIKQ
jgi:hypothetical protein